MYGRKKKKKEKKKEGIFCGIEPVAETHRNMCTCAYYVILGNAVATEWPARVKKTKKRRAKKTCIQQYQFEPSGRIQLKDDQDILPAAEMPELIIRNGEY